MPMKKTHSLVAVVIVTFILFNIFSFLLSAYYIKAEETSTSLNYAKESMLEIVEEKSELISIKFDRLKTNVKTVGALVEESLRTQMDTDTIPEDYIINEKRYCYTPQRSAKAKQRTKQCFGFLPI